MSELSTNYEEKTKTFSIQTKDKEVMAGQQFPQSVSPHSTKSWLEFHERGEGYSDESLLFFPLPVVSGLICSQNYGIFLSRCSEECCLNTSQRSHTRELDRLK